MELANVTKDTYSMVTRDTVFLFRIVTILVLYVESVKAPVIVFDANPMLLSLLKTSVFVKKAIS